MSTLTALTVAFVFIVCLLLCSPRRDEMLFRWLPGFVHWLIWRITGWYMARTKIFSYRGAKHPFATRYEWRRR